MRLPGRPPIDTHVRALCSLMASYGLIVQPVRHRSRKPEIGVQLPVGPPRARFRVGSEPVRKTGALVDRRFDSSRAHHSTRAASLRSLMASHCPVVQLVARRALNAELPVRIRTGHPDSTWTWSR